MIISKKFLNVKFKLEVMKEVAVVDKISDYLTPAAVIAEPQVSKH